MCLANMVGIIGNITFGDEPAFHRRGLCVSGSAYVTKLHTVMECYMVSEKVK